MTKGDGQRIEQLNRRKILAALGGGGMVSIAGCSGPQEDGSGGSGNESTTMAGESGNNGSSETQSPISTSTQGGTPKDGNFNWVYKTSFNPVEANLNPEALSSNVPWFMNRIWGGMSVQANLNGEPINIMAESFEVSDDGKTVTITFKEGFKWWDGTPLRAKDILAQTWYGNYTQYYQKTAPNREIEVLQEEPPKIRFNYKCQQNPQLALLNRRFSLNFPKYEFFEPALEKFADADGSESKTNTIAKDFGEKTLSMQDIVDEGWGLGLWKPSDWNTQRIVHTKVAEHPFADRTNLEKFTVEMLESNQKITQALSNDEVDGGDVGQISGATVPSDSVEINHTVPTGAQIGLKLNKANEHLAKPRVRRAMAYVINYEEVLKVLKSGLGVNAKYGGIQNASSSQIEENYLADDVLNEMIDYGKSAEVEKATQLMKDAGYSKQGGVWTDSSGSKISLTHIAPSWNKYYFISNYLNEKLGSFGIQTSVQALSSSGFQNKWQNTFEFDMATWYQQGLHPALWYGLGRNGKGWQELRGWGLSMLANPGDEVNCESTKLEIKDGKTVDDRLSQTIRPEYPAEVGTETLDVGSVGETKTLNPFVMVDTMRATQSSEELKRLSGEFAWYANWAVPNIELFDEVFTHYGDTENFSYPSEDAKEYSLRDLWIWANLGLIDGNPE